MPWWQNIAFSSPSSSSSTSSSRRRLTRARKLRHVRGNHIDALVRSRSSAEPKDLLPLPSSSSSFDHSSERLSSVVPHPLPRPELALLFRRNGGSNSNLNCDRPLPSPKEGLSRGFEDRDKGNSFVGDGNGEVAVSSTATDSKVAYNEARKSMEQFDTLSSRYLPQGQNSVKNNRVNFKLDVPTRSAPTSSLSSPAVSPQRTSTGNLFLSQNVSPQVFQGWSAPEMPVFDMVTGFTPQMSPEQTMFSTDNSPLHSPTVKSPHVNPRSPSGPASPLHPKISLETSTARRENNSHANVHRLPLPPGVVAPPQASSIHPVIAKTESFPMTTQWQKGKLIGRGTFGSVYVATNRETGALCAMKEVELLPDDPKSAESIKQLEQEIKILSQLKHPNIVQYFGSETVEDRLYIYLEYVHPGSINKYVREHCGAITESVVRNFTRHILSGLAYLHSTKTIHRDIKGANLLVDASGVVKLADFGMSKHLTGAAADLSLKGSPYWMAPELMQAVMQKDHSSDLAFAIDIWSLGCTIIEMLNGKPPWSEYEGAAAMFKVMRESPPIPKTLSSEGKDFLRCCFRRNPAERPPAIKLLEHRFLKNSTQLDVPLLTQAFSGMKLPDKANKSREKSNDRVDPVPISPRKKTSKGKKASGTGQQSHRETSDLTVASHHSPRSTLEALPSLSPPHSGQRAYHLSPPANVPSPINYGAKKKRTWG